MKPSFRVVFSITSDLWLSSNVDRHRMVKAKRVRELRTLAEATGAQFAPVARPVEVVAVIGYPTRRRADPPNAWPTVKALMDGLTDAGLWPDDNSEWVPKTSFTRDPIKSEKGTYRVTLVIREMEQE